MKKNKYEKDAILLIAETTIKIAGVTCVLSIVFLYCLFHEQVIKPNLTANNKVAITNQVSAGTDGFKNGIHQLTGFVFDENVDLVIANCTACHSAKLVTQNKATEQGWRDMIKWMQETQNLWDLGDKEDKIVQYLVKNYGPSKLGRRARLQVQNWYKLQDAETK